MVLGPPIERLYFALTELVALEKRIQRTIANLHGSVSTHPVAQDLFVSIDEMAFTHLGELSERLQTRADDEGIQANTRRLTDSADIGEFAKLHPVSKALGVAYTMVQEAIIGYSTIQPIALRAADSWVIADEGTTAGISRLHVQDYMGIAGQITALIHDVVVWELDSDGFVCRCTCPCCGIGICVGAASSRDILGEAWMAARPPVAEHGLELKPPHPGSAAAAGFLRGDVIVAIGGEKVGALPLLQRVISEHTAGDPMEFTVRRKTGNAKVTVVRRREGTDINEDECILPAGQQFYLEQARNVQRRLRKQRSANTLNGAALSGLSPRELQVQRLVAQGATNPIIAEELEISRATVARHVASILAKTGLANRTEAATLASQQGLLPDV